MESDISIELAKGKDSAFHESLLKHCKGLVEMSRSKMQTHYTKWDSYNETYKGERPSDAKDRKAAERGEPTKMIVPLTYAQVQTYVAFCMSLFQQNERMFELIGVGEEDYRAAKVGEALLERDLSYSTSEARLYQFLEDVAKYGLGIIKTGWVHETQQVREVVTTPEKKFMGFTYSKAQQEEVITTKTKFLGNRLWNVSPYRFFPDVRLPISRFQEGEFCASEDEYTTVSLKQLEAEGAITNVDKIKPMSKQALETRQTRGALVATESDGTTSKVSNSLGTCIVTEVQVNLIPSKFMLDGDKPLGPETYPVKFNIWYANDEIVIKCEPLGYLHNQFTYDVGEFSPDIHNLVNMGVCELIDPLQSVVTWFINSHITSVRQTIQNRLVVDPRGVEMSDISERRPIIRLNGAAAGGVERYVSQLQVQDVTASHVEDAQVMQQFLQVVTGINDNALGQFHQGRRSATEARTVNSATASRLKLSAMLLFKTALKPMAEKMLSNHRDGLDEETYVRVMGDTADPALLQQFTKVTRNDLVGNYDFKVFDATMPSERGAQAEALQEFIGMLMQAPQLIQVLGYDITSLIKEVLELRGVRGTDRFRTPQTIAAANQPMLAQAQPQQQNV